MKTFFDRLCKTQEMKIKDNVEYILEYKLDGLIVNFPFLEIW